MLGIHGKCTQTELNKGYSYLVKGGFFGFFPNFSLLFVDSRPDDLLHERALLIYLCAPTAGAGTKYSQQMMSNGRNVTIDKSSWNSLFLSGIPAFHPSNDLWQKPPEGPLHISFIVFLSCRVLQRHFSTSFFLPPAVLTLSIHSLHLPSALGSKHLRAVQLWETRRWLIGKDYASQPCLHIGVTRETSRTYWWRDSTPRNSNFVWADPWQLEFLKCNSYFWCSQVLRITALRINTYSLDVGNSCEWSRTHRIENNGLWTS